MPTTPAAKPQNVASCCRKCRTAVGLGRSQAPSEQKPVTTLAYPSDCCHHHRVQTTHGPACAGVQWRKRMHGRKDASIAPAKARAVLRHYLRSSPVVRERSPRKCGHAKIHTLGGRPWQLSRTAKAHACGRSESQRAVRARPSRNAVLGAQPRISLARSMASTFTGTSNGRAGQKRRSIDFPVTSSMESRS